MEVMHGAIMHGEQSLNLEYEGVALGLHYPAYPTTMIKTTSNAIFANVGLIWMKFGV